jgi:hypothetical protein
LPPTLYSNIATYFVALVSVILLAPENVKVVSVFVPVSVETSNASDVARTAPVGVPVEPNVPV